MVWRSLALWDSRTSAVIRFSLASSLIGYRVFLPAGIGEDRVGVPPVKHTLLSTSIVPLSLSDFSDIL